MPYNPAVYTFVETKLFTRLIDEYLSDDEYAALQLSLAVTPRPGTSLKAQAVFAKCAGPAVVAASAVGFV